MNIVIHIKGTIEFFIPLIAVQIYDTKPPKVQLIKKKYFFNKWATNM